MPNNSLFQGIPGADGTDGIDGAAVEVEDEGISLTPNVSKINFIGAGVTVTEPIADEVDVTIPGPGPTVFEASATVSTTTTSGTDVLIPGMTITPGAGNYVAMFNSSWENNNAEDMFASIYANGVQIPHSERITEQESSIPDAELAVATHAVVTGLLAGQDIDVRFRTTGGTLTMLRRTLILIKAA